VVVKSSVGIYGAEPDDPSFMREDMAGRSSPRSPLVRDLLEMEQLVQDFGIRNPAVTATVLRLGYKLGLRDQTPLTRYFSLPLVPTVAGFDPRIQLLHEEDAIEALFRATVADHPGVFNVSGDGVLLLSQAIKLAGRREFSLLPPYGRLVGRLVLRGVAGFNLPAPLLDFITFGQVVDCSRLEEEFGWRPGYSTRSVVLDFAARTSQPMEDLPVSAPQERELQLYIRRRERMRQLPAPRRVRRRRPA
jgi:UDP-glucose 4-epimerase